MSEREKAAQLLNQVPDNKISYVISILEKITIPNEIPNNETIEAMKELENGGGTIFEGTAHDFIKMMLED